MDQENIMFFKNQNESYTMLDLYQNRFFEYKDSYNHYDVNIDKILLFKKSDGQYIIRYKDVNKLKIAPLQLKIKNFFCELHTYRNNNRVMYIHNDDKEFFRKCREIWNKIIELIGTNSLGNFVDTTLDDDADEFITSDVYKKTSFVGGNYRNKLITVLHSFFNDYLQTSLVQHRY